MVPAFAKYGLLAAGLTGLVAASGMSSVTQEQLGWGRATQALTRNTPTPQQTAALSAAIAQWKSLKDTPSGLPFETYAGFLVAHPGWPNETALRRAAEKALDGTSPYSAPTAVVFFRRYPPLTGVGRVRFAEALAATGATVEAQAAARIAWTAGALSTIDEAKIITGFSSSLTQADQDARMDMLLWQGATGSAQRQLALTSAARRPVFAARLAFRTNAADASAQASATQAMGAGDPGWLADRATWLRGNGGFGARELLARRPALAMRPANVGAWFDVLAANAKGAVADAQYATAYDIVRGIDDAYPDGTEIAAQPYGERDDYTDLTWLAGRAALKQLNRPADAIAMFVRYSRGSRSPSIQAKGLYWAGRSAEAAGRREEANGYYMRAAGFPDLFYGQLSAERLGRPLVAPVEPVMRPVDPVVRDAFYARETVRAAQYLGQTGNWEDQTAFVRQIATDAKTDSDHVLATELSRTLGRPDLGVMVGRSALQNGLSDYSTVGFPSVKVPAGANDYWTMVHAIARQESQFDRAAVSRVGARGLMQLMPGTARETSLKIGMPYNAAALNSDTDYNIMLGSSYFARIYNLYGSYPLAVAAYNAGPGNVNKWLKANGDPRSGSIEWVDWIEAIPLTETRGYVQHVLENAVVYDLMNAQHSRSTGANRISWYLGKGRPG
ncbi:lytic transglycosylase domain-containing protein [Sphingomonas immobilis]|uniref:Lytic transglycosylase domain-containing protein n=1 Tax=Sphingomonas immobilis TaxID=3063997 RepID=A0ABT9A3F6_9SPHN|nr:lytic transglycosylase domain-containing protein [Sphingomonas sp. CA1-15]MDO7844374.1 lytic transglycosylase domain-containing protein [Sphingomonas sp. CA1-15]